jgi:hypothetical protein
MSRSGILLAIIAFLAIIYGVPIGQAVIEIRNNGRVQFLDLVEDWLVTPVRYQNTKALKAKQLAEKTDSLEALVGQLKDTARQSGGEVFQKAVTMADDAVFLADEVKKALLNINRHVVGDTMAPLCLQLDSLRVKFDGLKVSLQDGAVPQTFDADMDVVKESVREIVRKNGSAKAYAYPILISESFLHTIFSGKYLRKYEKEMEDKSWAVNMSRPVLQFVWYGLLKNAGDKAVVGRDNWLFYKQDVEYLVRPQVTDIRSVVVDANDKPFREQPMKAIVNFRDQLRDMGIELLVVVIPGKPSIYPDKLSLSVPVDKAGILSHSVRAIEQLRSEGVEAVDLFTPFAQERRNDETAGEYLYLSKDTHWRTRGVRLAAKVVAERVRQYPWYTPGNVDYVIDTITVNRIGDVGVMTALPSFKVRGLHMQFEPEPTLCYQVFKVERDSVGEVVSRELYRDDFRRSSILVLGDSFSRIFQTDEPRGAGWISHLAYELSQPVGSIVSDGGASTLVRQTLARKPGVLKGKKLVIWEFVERDFRFGAEGWKDVQISLDR